MPNDPRSIEQRRWSMRQAIANCKIEGFEPDAEFLEESERIVRGEVTTEESIARIIKKYQKRAAAKGALDV